MKTLMLVLTSLILTVGSVDAAMKPKPCGKYQGHNLYKGEKGGCYYLKTKKKVKVYVDKQHCNCK